MRFLLGWAATAAVLCACGGSDSTATETDTGTASDTALSDVSGEVRADAPADGNIADSTTGDGAADAAADAADAASGDAKDGGKALGSECLLDDECASGLKCCGGGAVGLPKHCTPPDPKTGNCPLVP